MEDQLSCRASGACARCEWQHGPQPEYLAKTARSSRHHGIDNHWGVDLCLPGNLWSTRC